MYSDITSKKWKKKNLKLKMGSTDGYLYLRNIETCMLVMVLHEIQYENNSCNMNFGTLW